MSFYTFYKAGMTEQNQNNNNDFAIMNDVTICLNHFMCLQTLLGLTFCAIM